MYQSASWTLRVIRATADDAGFLPLPIMSPRHSSSTHSSHSRFVERISPRCIKSLPSKPSVLHQAHLPLKSWNGGVRLVSTAYQLAMYFERYSRGASGGTGIRLTFLLHSASTASGLRSWLGHSVRSRQTIRTPDSRFIIQPGTFSCAHAEHSFGRRPPHTRCPKATSCESA